MDEPYRLACQYARVFASLIPHASIVATHQHGRPTDTITTFKTNLDNKLVTIGGPRRDLLCIALKLHQDLNVKHVRALLRDITSLPIKPFNVVELANGVVILRSDLCTTYIARGMSEALVNRLIIYEQFFRYELKYSSTYERGWNVIFLIPCKEKMNDFIADQLELEAATRRGYAASALLNAARIIRTMPVEVTTASQLKGVKGIGKGTLDRVTQILLKGEEYEPPPLPAEEQVMVQPQQQEEEEVKEQSAEQVYDFKQIKFIGEATNRRLHEQGIHTLEQLEEAVETGEVTLQPNQLAGLKYREDLAERIPRDEVVEIARIVLNTAIKYGMTGSISGSYRRGKADSGDVDILITGPVNRLADIVEELSYSLIEYIYSIGTVKTQLIAISPYTQKYRSLDIRYVPPESYGSFLLFSTGPWELNVHQRQLAIDQGMKLSEYGLFNAEGELIAGKTEEEVYEALGMEYLPPEEREQYNTE